MFASGLQYLTFYMSISHILTNTFTIQTHQSHKQNECCAHCGKGYFSKKTQKFELSFSVQCFKMPNLWLKETFDSVQLQFLKT